MTHQKQENRPKDDSTKTRKQSKSGLHKNKNAIQKMTQQKQENSPYEDSTKTRKQSKR